MSNTLLGLPSELLTLVLSGLAKGSLRDLATTCWQARQIVRSHQMRVLTLDYNPRSKSLASRIIDDAARAIISPDKYGSLALGQCINHPRIENTSTC
jgi:hypothetical protein